MRMRATQGVSFPRSGHEIVYHIARRYFGEAFVYCDLHNPGLCGCGSVPCVNPDRTFAKNHDFGLRRSPGVPILPTERYLIQYRSPVWSITSNFKLYLKRHPDENDRAGWERFAFRDVFLWNRFIDKWVLDFPPDANPPQYCTYEELIDEPEVKVREVMAFLSDGPLDDDRISADLERFPIAPRRTLSEFEFFDPVFFRELEDAASGRLAELDLPSVEEAL
jgi:hypothetical protein